MPKAAAKRFLCRECGALSAVWSGRCNDCGQWNTLEEQTNVLGGYSQKIAFARPAKSASHATAEGLQIRQLGDSVAAAEFLPLGITEFDRVLGGGLVPGAAILIGGDPGIGKSTLLLQAASLCGEQHQVLYISGEESVEQILLRAQRLPMAKDTTQTNKLELAAETAIEPIIDALSALKPTMVVIDSIQTMYASSVESAPGTVSQVRTCSHLLMSAAKKLGFCLLLIGHVTKEGAIAGPRVLEHMVDTVLYFEGDRSQHFRLLRAVKNRFGPCDEIGVFEMTSQGLVTVDNPSALFLAERTEAIAGTCVVPALEGSRPILVEIQALVSQSYLATPRRTLNGWDQQRLAMVLAVLEKRYGYNFSRYDVYLNVTGGFRLQEPAADLAVVVALISSLGNHPVPIDLTAFGEIGLTGEIRAVPQADLRLKEAAKLGFKQAMLPQQKRLSSPKILQISAFADLQGLADLFPPPAPSMRDGQGMQPPSYASANHNHFSSEY